ncbi:MAG: hypothetical protein JNJ73_18120 [Hyphomonadaceae bacterium]|nr:hypothetical protein [Hyphomonadaceae bacterium]
MMDRVFEGIIATAAMAAAAVMAVFAAGFALYALLLTWLQPAAAAAAVAGAAAAFAAVFGMLVRARAEHRKLMEEVERARAVQAAAQSAAQNAAQAAAAAPRSVFSADVSSWLNEHPLAALAVSALGGFLATRHPALAGEIIAALRGFRRDTDS